MAAAAGVPVGGSGGSVVRNVAHIRQRLRQFYGGIVTRGGGQRQLGSARAGRSGASATSVRRARRRRRRRGNGDEGEEALRIAECQHLEQRPLLHGRQRSLVTT